MEFRDGDLLWLDAQVPGLPYPCGYWVLCEKGEARSYVSLASPRDGGQFGSIDNWYLISTEDLNLFQRTGKTAIVYPPTQDALKQEHEL